MHHRILLVREWDAQTAASGCCGRLGSAHSELGEAVSYAHNRREMERMGEVYRALKGELFDEEVEISVVDPRNQVWLIPNVLKDARKSGMGFGDAIAQLRRGISYNSVILDGKTLFHGYVPSPEEAVAAVREELGVRA